MQENRQEKSPIKQKILLYLDKKGVSSYEFYKKTGVTRGILTQNNGISEENIARFLDYAPDVNLDWLITGKGSMFRKNEELPITQEPLVSNNKDQGTPYYDVDFTAGFNEVFNDQTILPTCNIIVPGLEKATVWCNVTGHSMEPKINPGDIIALRECTVSDIQYGEIYAVVLDTIRTIKILRKGSAPDTLRFVPINVSGYDEQEFNVSRIIRIFEVIGSISKFF